MQHLAEALFGSSSDLTVLQMVARAIAIFCLTLSMIRCAGRRSFGQRSPFDVCTSVLLGAVLSRAVVGASPFLATVAAGFALALLHRSLGWVSIRWPAFDRFISGSERVLVWDGVEDREAMRKALVGTRDLEEALRKHHGPASGGRIQAAVLERDGAVSLTRAD